MADFESERRECLRTAQLLVGWDARLASWRCDSRLSEVELRDVLWRLMVGSHSKS